MVAVSGGLLFAGYTLVVYGWSQVNHGNAGLLDILWPGRYKGNPQDGPNGINPINPATPPTLLNPTGNPAGFLGPNGNKPL